MLSFVNNSLIDENVSQDAYDVIRLTRSKAAVSGQCGAFDRFFIKNYLFIFTLSSINYDPDG